jgi:hypothetical protein
MYCRRVCGVELGLCERHDCVHFTCPCCGATHDRGYVNGVDRFRCLGCGYSGHGLHPDAETDRELYQEHLSINALHRTLGLPEVPFTHPDPLSGPG